MRCPRDGASLEQVKQAGLEVDRCQTCSGVWLDKGEGEMVTRPDVAVESLADEVAARVEKFLSRENQPELAGLRIVRNMRDLDRLNAPQFIRVYLAHEFGA